VKNFDSSKSDIRVGLAVVKNAPLVIKKPTSKHDNNIAIIQTYADNCLKNTHTLTGE